MPGCLCARQSGISANKESHFAMQLLLECVYAFMVGTGVKIVGGN